MVKPEYNSCTQSTSQFHGAKDQYEDRHEGFPKHISKNVDFEHIINIESSWDWYIPLRSTPKSDEAHRGRQGAEDRSWLNHQLLIFALQREKRTADIPVKCLMLASFRLVPSFKISSALKPCNLKNHQHSFSYSFGFEMNVLLNWVSMERTRSTLNSRSSERSDRTCCGSSERGRWGRNVAWW